ncbi:MAG: PEGA domain-containing protein [Sideroxydans sp.]|nr:PEGA domain-containing protein [Sideroxydans sp.]
MKIALWIFGALLSIHVAHADSFFSSDGLLHAKELKLADASVAKNAATLRIRPYLDQRTEQDARLLGVFNTRIGGLSGKQLRLDRDVAVIATEQMKQQFSNAGFAVLAEDAAAKFELSGVVKTLTLDSKARDEINIVLETSVSEIATGKVIWTAAVSQANSRFGGVAGNDRDDIVNFLYRELAVVNGKTVSAVNSLLMASYPALFNLTPGTRTIDGVTVLSAPLATPVAVTSAIVVEKVASSTGTLMLSSTPSRAKIYVNEVYFGLTPLRVELDAGLHSITAKLAGRKVETEKIAVRKGETTELEMTLSK